MPRSRFGSSSSSSWSSGYRQLTNKQLAARRIQRAWRSRNKNYSSSKVDRFYRGTLHHFKRTTFQNNLSVSCDASGNAYQAHAWALADLTNSSSFTRLWDAYRIRKVKMEFLPVANQSPYTSPTSGYVPKICIVADYNDETAPTSIEDMLQRAGAKLKTFSRNQSKIVQPAIAGEAFVSQLSQGYTEKKGAWIPTADPNVKQYGIKVAFTALPSQVIKYHMRTTYWFSMKSPKST